MTLHKVMLLIAIAEQGTLKLLSPMFDRTYHINDDYECVDQPQQFIYLARSIFLNECERGLVEGVDLKRLENYFVDATVLDIEVIPSEQLCRYFNSNLGIKVYHNF